jgi:hypothetical protein
MKIELDLILKQTNSKFFMKIIENKDFKISKEQIKGSIKNIYNNKMKLKSKTEEPNNADQNPPSSYAS